MSDASARRAYTPSRQAHLDPLGKRALFWAQPDAPAAGALGKRALYSTAGDEPSQSVGDPSERPLADRGPVSVECSRCGVVTRINFLDLLIFQFPIGYWFPRAKFDRRMRCPACRRRTWASVTLRERSR